MSLQYSILNKFVIKKKNNTIVVLVRCYFNFYE